MKIIIWNVEGIRVYCVKSVYSLNLGYLRFR